MKNSSDKETTDVYEFGDVEMAVEAESSKYAAKFQIRALDNYSFLHNFTDKKKTNEDMCIDIREMDDMAPQINSMMDFSTNYNQHLSTLGMEVNMVPNGENSSCQSESDPSSSSHSDEPEINGCSEQHACDEYYTYSETIGKEGEIILRPDYVTFDTEIYVEPICMFSPEGIKLEGKDSEDQEVSTEWHVSNIVYIHCQWSPSTEGATMKIMLSHETESEETRFIKMSVIFFDSNWQEKEQNIKNLSSRYTEIWNSIPIEDIISDDDLISSASFFSKHYFSPIGSDFEEVIYPKGDPDAVSISKRDIDLLLPETFINDTIIDFYVKYLNKHMNENRRKSLHFFNSFFFRKLADLDKDQGNNLDGRAAFLRVRKWTRKVNVFDKDFIFIPVNFNLHWSLLVICHPGEIVRVGEEEISEIEKMPCILHMDSLRGTHCGLKNIIQSYLWEEWKERNPNSTEDTSKFSNLRFVSLDVPQQDNCFDCGLFLLHFVELFLEDSPLQFNPFKINKFSSFLTQDWFPPADASYKRSVIRKLIYDLLYNTCTNGSSQKIGTELEKDENGIEVLSQPFCCPSEPVVSSVCPVNGDVDGLERVFEDELACRQNTCELVPDMVEPETCLLEDDEEEDEELLCSTSFSAKMEDSEENRNGETSHCQLSPNLLEDSDDMEEEQAQVPSSPQPDMCGYVPDTPAISLNDTPNEIPNEIRETPVVSSSEVEKSNELQIAVVPDTPIVDSSLEVVETPVLAEKEEETLLPEMGNNHVGSVLETPVGTFEDTELKRKEKEEYACITGEMENSKDEGDVISDDEGSVETPSKKRRKVNALESSRRLTRSTLLKGSDH